MLKDDKHKKQEFLIALKKEWELKKDLIHSPIQSIYFGGGTPSKLSLEAWKEIFSWFKELQLAPLCEITVEANPEDLNKDYLKGLLSLSVNRLSIGVQTLDDTLLKSLSRSHSSKKAKEVIYEANEVGFTNISIDLMYDLPKQTVESFENTLQQIGKLPITHLSLYNLQFEAPSLFYKKRKSLLPLLPKETESLKMHQLACVKLANLGFKQYEISAFAKENYESLHNSGYWKARPFIGFGPSAFSYLDNTRSRNCLNLKKYITFVTENKIPEDFAETLSFEERQKELFAVQLRLFEGIDLLKFTEKNGPLCSSLKKNLSDLIQEEFIHKKGRTYFLSSKGRLFYDTVGERLI